VTAIIGGGCKTRERLINSLAVDDCSRPGALPGIPTIFEDIMEKTRFIKDIPVGVLIIVLAQFVFYGVVYLANFPKLSEMFGIVIGTLVSSDMINYGVKLIKGYTYDPNK
jgi:hypothetical protein